MELERPATGRGGGGERPVTRWRRDQEETTRPQSRIERPSSRRGAKIESQEINSSSSGGSGGYRTAVTAVSGRTVVVGRPPSASAFSNRVMSAATSRVSTTSGSSLPTQGQSYGRLGTGLPPATQVNILDRPITQQGIAGLRPGTNRGLPMTRQEAF